MCFNDTKSGKYIVGALSGKQKTYILDEKRINFLDKKRKLCIIKLEIQNMVLRLSVDNGKPVEKRGRKAKGPKA